MTDYVDVVRKHPWYRTHKVLNWLAGLRPNIRRLTSICRNIVGGVGGVIGSVCSMYTQGYFKKHGFFTFLDTWHSWIIDNRFSLTLIVLVAFGLLSLMSRLARESFDKKKLKKILGATAAICFGDVDLSKHAYRATLFKARRTLFFRSWLGIVARSGSGEHKSSTIFSIGNSPEYNTGIAGQCYFQNGATIIKTLPNISHDDGQQAISEYQKVGFLAPDEYKKLDIRALVLLATGIRTDEGKIWGILVLDTTDPNMTFDCDRTNTRVNRHRTHLEFAATALTQLIS